MSQATDWGVPRNSAEADLSEDDWAARADISFDAILSAHKGSSAPSYAVAGTVWIDDTGAPWIVNVNDGTDDIQIGTINATDNWFMPSQRRVESVKTADHTIAAADAEYLIVMNKASAGTVNLPAISGSASELYCVKNIASDDVTIDPNSSETIEGASTLTLHTGDLAFFWPDTTPTSWRAMVVPATGAIVRYDVAQSLSTAEQVQARINIGLGAPDIILRDEKSSGTDGGDATSGAWRTRDMNTEDRDVGNNCSLASNAFTLDSGTYYIEASAPAFAVNRHKSKIRNTSDGGDSLIGTSEFVSNTTPASVSRSQVAGIVTIASAKTFELQHYFETTQPTNGLGVKSTLGVVEIYGEVRIWKIA